MSDETQDVDPNENLWSADNLWEANPDCVHDIIDGPHFSGIKCSKCPGWFCY